MSRLVDGLSSLARCKEFLYSLPPQSDLYSRRRFEIARLYRPCDTRQELYASSNDDTFTMNHLLHAMYQSTPLLVESDSHSLNHRPLFKYNPNAQLLTRATSVSN